MSCAQWADAHFYLSPESSISEGPWRTQPQQRAILNVMGNDDVQRVTFTKAARLGFTKMVTAATCYLIEHRRRNGVLYQPTDSDAEEYVKDELEPALRDSTVMADLLSARRPGQTRGRTSDTLGEKHFRGATLHIKGGKSPGNYRRLTKDFVVYDELDGFDLNVGDEGDAVKLGDRRLQGAAFPKSIRGSTPKLEGSSQIQRSAETADLELFCYVPCPECGTFQAMTWDGLRWDDADPESARYHCCAQGCEARWRFAQLWELVERCEWRSEDGHVTHDGLELLDPEGRRTRWPRHVCFRQWAIYSPLYPWPDIVADWLECQGDDEGLQTFINTVRGEVFRRKVREVSPIALMQAREEYEAPEGILVVVAATDVQEDRLETLVVGFGDGEEAWHIAHRVFWGDTQQTEVWEDHERYINAERVARDDGSVLRISAVGLDTGFRTKRCYDYAAESRHPRLYRLKGVGGEAPEVAAPKGRTRVFSVGANALKDLVLSRLMLQEGDAGRLHFSGDCSEEYFRQLTAERAVMRKVRGFEKRTYEKVRHRNEILDLWCYAFATLFVLNPDFSALSRNTAAKAERASQPAAPKKRRSTSIDQQFRRARRQRRSGRPQ